MCGRFTSTSTLEQLAATYGVEEVRGEPLPERYNVAPTQQVYAVALSRSKDEGERPRRQLGQFRWGLVPSWAKDPSIGSRMINARSEGLATKPAYRAALERRRCIIPADAFYEWQERGTGKGKLPFAIRRRDGESMGLAGLWEVWREAPDAEPLRTCVIVTCAANAALAAIHDRMPVVLAPESWAAWLDPGTPAEEAEALLVPAPPEWFEAFPVSTAVNKVSNDGPDLLTPLPPPPGEH
ncbi:MAG: SOS response-associated peptidase [Acidimicrobiales bacterium]